MNVEEYLSNFHKQAKNPTLDAMKFFMDEFGNPDKDLKIIHIAGTNGKGSSTEMMTNILINAGYRVGKFISPHLEKYNERISVQHENITDNEMEELIEIIKPKIEKYNTYNETKVTLFELETTMALLYFKKKKCDFVVLETGLGGTYDCTNIVNPIVSLITSVGYDHMHILGNTLTEIAQNKAGIIKENSETVFVKQKEDEANKVIENTCVQKNNVLHLIDIKDVLNYSYDIDYQKFDYKEYSNVLVNLKGEKQVNNACLCIECAKVLKSKGYEISEESIKEGLRTVIHKARFETLCDNPMIIYDGAHNQPAIANFIRSVEMYYPENPKVYVVSILATKDYKNMIEQLLKYDEKATFIFTDGNDKTRYVPKEKLEKEAEKYADISRLKIQDLKNIADEIKKYNDSIIFFVGSFYIYGDVKKIIKDLNLDIL